MESAPLSNSAVYLFSAACILSCTEALKNGTTLVCPETSIIPRSAWGARASGITRTGGTVENATLPYQLMVYTHTVTRPCRDLASCRHIVKEIQNRHMDSGESSDIAYNFLIGSDGSVFEGRGWQIKGAFSRTYNSKGFGIAFIGSFSEDSSHLTFQAAKSAHYLLKCAQILGHLKPGPFSQTMRTINIKSELAEDIRNPLPSFSTTTERQATEQKFMNSSDDLSYFPVTSEQQTDSSAFTNAGIASGIIALALLVFIIGTTIVYRCKNRKPVTRDYRAAIQKLVPPHVVTYFERPRWSIDLNNAEDSCIGKGQGGIVFKAAMIDKNRRKALHHTNSGRLPVAVKMLRKTYCDYQDTAGFLAEMSILMKVGRHVNIVNLEGVILKGKLMMIMEHCELGSLDIYLRGLSNSTPSCGAGDILRLANSYVAFDTTREKEVMASPNVAELITIAHQISRGMEFLSSKNVIHRDLAARNILLTRDKTVKIADFGMAKELPEYVLERDKVPLPVCWMAPESMVPGRGVFTALSDVWSFGVLLWEIFSMGETPYKKEFADGIGYNRLYDFLQEGYRLIIPDLCPKTVAVIMLECWNLTADGRPSFYSLRSRLESLLPADVRSRYVTFDAENRKLNQELNVVVSEMDKQSRQSDTEESPYVVINFNGKG